MSKTINISPKSRLSELERNKTEFYVYEVLVLLVTLWLIMRKSILIPPKKDEYRLSKAAELLKKTVLPVSDVSSNVGFHQTSHFGKCFKEKTGYSPREYRSMENDPGK